MRASTIAASELLIMLDITRRLAEQRLVQPLMEYVARTAFDVVAAERCAIVLFDSNGAPQVAVARDRLGGSLDDAQDQLSRSILEHVRRDSVPLLLDDAMSEDAFQESASVHSLSLRSVMCAPLVSHGQVLGAIYVENRSERGQFTEESLAPLALLANQVVVALENARAYEALQEHVRALGRTNDELSRALRLKNEFLAMMSHELRTPLNVVLGISQGLQEDVYGAMSDRQRRAVDKITQSGQHLLQVLSDVLDLAQLGATAAPLNLVPADLGQICAAALGVVAGRAAEKGIAISAAVPPPTPGLVVDERRLAQVLVNLLDNAVKFTPSGGAVGLDVVCDAQAGRVSFAVWDTGIGIDPDDQPRLFQAFTQVDGRLARRYGGIGLGLTIVHRLVELHGGQVHVESAPGAGSRFTVTLPWSVPVGEPGRLGSEKD